MEAVAVSGFTHKAQSGNTVEQRFQRNLKFEPRQRRPYAEVKARSKGDILPVAPVGIESVRLFEGNRIAIRGGQQEADLPARFDDDARRGPTPTPRPGDTVIMDNLSGHKRAPVSELIKARGARLGFLPPCSPDFNPLEMAFAKLKVFLRKAAERTVDGLWSAIGRLVDNFTPQECDNYFSAAGYDADRAGNALTSIEKSPNRVDTLRSKIHMKIALMQSGCHGDDKIRWANT